MRLTLCACRDCDDPTMWEVHSMPTDEITGSGYRRVIWWVGIEQRVPEEDDNDGTAYRLHTKFQARTKAECREWLQNQVGDPTEKPFDQWAFL